VPGGMLTNMESQLKEQGAEDKFDEVLLEIPRVREDLGFIPLVTPTSQIVGSQAVINVLTGERYKSISRETAGVLRGEYGATAAAVNAELQARVLEGEKLITCRPADNIADELDELDKTLTTLAQEKSLRLAKDKIDDVLTYALFPQVGLKFIENRDNPSAFEPAPLNSAEVIDSESTQPFAANSAAYAVKVEGQVYHVEVAENGEVTHISASNLSTPSNEASHSAVQTPAHSANSTEIKAPLSGNIVKVVVEDSQPINEGDVILILEAMKMETEVRSTVSGRVAKINVNEGDAVQVGQTMMLVS
jgi:oxaloacetate decarboxylase alpha subunit